MNLIDLFLCLIIVFSIWRGWTRGFLIGFTGLITWILGLFIAFFSYGSVARLVSQTFNATGVWTAPLAFIAMLLISQLFLSFIFKKLLSRSRPNTHQHIINKLMGLFPGFINGLISAVIIAALLLALPIADNFSSYIRGSQLAGPLAQQIEWLDDKLAPVFDEAVKKSINNLVIKPESKKRVQLPFQVKNADVREDLELQMVDLINRERIKENLILLKIDTGLALVARKHSADMFSRGYFSHYSPEDQTVSDRLRQANVRFLTAGENLALAQTLLIAHNGLMNSPGHRANILHKSYGRVGIGILDGGVHGLMVTQVFRN